MDQLYWKISVSTTLEGDCKCCSLLKEAERNYFCPKSRTMFVREIKIKSMTLHFCLQVHSAPHNKTTISGSCICFTVNIQGCLTVTEIPS